ncbi:MAG: AMP-binding protein [Candidatus Aminicenantes bacterium]|nr:AMP-binding protein [Candidatus Aminicenantes bacterium]
MMIFRASDYQSVVEPLIHHSKTGPEKIAVVFINDDETEEFFSYRQLHENALRYARVLKTAGIQSGDIVILALRHKADLIWSLMGALYLGAIPSIFIYKGPMTPLGSYIRRVKKMVEFSQASMVVALPDYAAELEDLLSGAECQVLNIEAVPSYEESMGIPPQPEFTSGEDIAYLQYTSGTTGMQKGVMLSHRAILNYGESTAIALKITDQDVFVNWLPLYHDFGLFGGLFISLFCGISTVLMSPYKWLRKPHLHLWAIHNHKGTISFLPNSAHHHTVRYVNDRSIQGLDLSSLRVLFNGAEPILYRSQELFLERFAAYGFSENAFVSGYGMAENTLGVSYSAVGKRARVDWVDAREMKISGKAVPAPRYKESTKPVVSCGPALTGTELAILDDLENRLSDRHIGEITIRSTALFSGYYKRPDLTAQVMKNGWYRTGDMGYMAGNELYVCGRKKDLIIVGGDNIHPEDLESIAQSVPGIRPDRSVAFGVHSPEIGTEKIVMVCEIINADDESQRLAIERELRRRVYNDLEVTIGDVHLVKKGWIEKTQNSKIARKANREKYEEYLAVKEEA